MRMSGYGKAAVRAVELYTTGLVDSPQEAWDWATAEVFGGTSSQEKGCPKGAFLGLCEAGLIRGVPRGAYTRSRKNKKYALEAVALLKGNPALAADRAGLWSAIVRGESKKHNQQMDVVVSLWNKGLLFGNGNPALGSFAPPHGGVRLHE
jgi:hypothetical protein